MKYPNPLYLLLIFFFVNVAVANEREPDCQHWPEQFSDYGGEYVIAYKGECKSGFAHGKGTISTYEKWRSEDPAKTKLQGYFNQGVFFGDRNYQGKLIVDRHQVFTQIDNSKNKPVWLLAFAPNAKPFPLCEPKIINVGTQNMKQYTENSDAAKTELKRAFSFYTKLCPNTDSDILVAMTEIDKVMQPEYMNSKIYAEMNNTKKDVFVNYRNIAYEELAYEKKRKQEEADRQAKINEVNKNILTFFKNNKVTELVSVEQLEKNPFLWDGKIVAVPATLDKMLSKDTAFIQNVNGYYGASLYIINITPSLFKRADLIVAVEVSGKMDVEGRSYSAVSYVGHYTCEAEKCQDLAFAGIKDYSAK